MNKIKMIAHIAMTQCNKEQKKESNYFNWINLHYSKGIIMTKNQVLSAFNKAIINLITIVKIVYLKIITK